MNQTKAPVNGLPAPPNDETAEGNASTEPTKKGFRLFRSASSSEKKEKEKMRLTLKVFRYATGYDKFLLILSIVMNIANGMTMPLFMLFFGDMINEFGAPSEGGIDINRFVLIQVYIGIGAFLVGGIGTAAIELAAERQIRQIRHHYLDAVMRQEMGWFDSFDSGTLASRLNQNCVNIRDGIGTKLGQLFMFAAMFVGGYVIGFIRGWQMALVLSAALPVLAACGFFLMYLLSSAETQAHKAYAEAGSVAEETIGSIRTVAAFGAEEKSIERFTAHLAHSTAYGVKGGFASGIGLGTTFGCMFLSYALGFWFGGKMVANDLEAGCTEGCFQGGNALAVFFSVVIAAFSLGQAGPPLTSFMKAGAAVDDLLSLIERKSLIDPTDPQGKSDVELKGDIVFKGVQFAYPTRQEKPVFDGIDLHIPAGKTVALVGGSGCGKSTAIQLIQRFYDPTGGQVLIDGVDLRDYNLKWIRDQMSLVSQEPRLFARSIFENIRDGRLDATPAEVENAAKNSNALGFIAEFPNGFDTYVGESGSQLSGGQKQRIAIARAMLRDPTILILDEATSALDNESERIVQNTLDALIAQRQRTTVVIAHRLTTVRNADKIIVLDNAEGTGARVAEEGTHEELMAIPDGIYQALVEAQRLQGDLERVSSRKLSREMSSRSALADPHVVEVEKKLSSLLRKTSTFTKDTAALLPVEADFTAPVKVIPKPPRYTRVLGSLAPHWLKLTIGILGAILGGLVFPIFAILYAEFIGVYFLPDVDELRRETSFWSLMFVALAVYCFVTMTTQHVFMEWAGQLLVRELRYTAFSSMMYQDMSYFDDPDHNTGTLSQILSSDVLLVKGWSGDNLAIIIQNIATLVAALIISFLASPKLAAVSLAAFAVMAPAGALRMKYMQGDAKAIAEGAETAGYVINETIVNIRTVTAYNLQKRMLDAYDVVINEDCKRGIFNAYLGGFFFGVAQFIQFGSQALALWYGAELMRSGEITNISDMLRAIFSLMMAAMGVGQSMVFMTDIKKAKDAGARVYEVIDRVPLIDARDSSGKELIHEEMVGEIQVENVNFRYPQRRDVPIFRDVSFRVKAGQTVALVGASGCGKSTIIQLVERFYDVEGGKAKDPMGGSVKVDGVDVRDANVKSLRGVLGLVGQEPILFNTTITENIRYGKADATDEDVIEAAKMANAHDFITQFPAGYDTVVGKFGGQLSGGQKQRIAIARAMIRNPKILLLDEATSALDAESEKVVQTALDNLLARSRRTTIVIAHRLSTIQNSDVIVVLANPDKTGSAVVEVGNHEELMRIPDGVYRNLVNIASAGEKGRKG